MFKKPYLSFAFFFIVSTSAYAQLFIGPVAGPQVSMMTVSDRNDTASSAYRSLPGVGFHVGAMISMQVKKQYYLTGSIEYSQRRKVIRSKEDPLYKDYVNMHYIDVPIYYSLEFKQARGKFTGKGGKLVVYDWFVGGGPVISYWLGGKGKLKSSGLHEKFVDEQPYTITFSPDDTNLDEQRDANKINVSDPNRFQFSFNITGGMAFQPVGFQRIVVSAGLELAQTFLSKEKNAFIPNSSSEAAIMQGKLHNFRLSVSYVIDTKVAERNRGKSTLRTNQSKKKGKK